MNSKIGKVEWLAVYVISGLIDVAQLFIELTGVGIGANDLADPFIGGLFLLYFQLRGVNMFNPTLRIIALFGGAGLEELTGGGAPAWIAAVWIIHRSVRGEKRSSKDEGEDESNNETRQEGPQKESLYDTDENGEAFRRPENDMDLAA